MQLFIYKTFTLLTLGLFTAVASFLAGAVTHAWAVETKKDDETPKSGPILS